MSIPVPDRRSTKKIFVDAHRDFSRLVYMWLIDYLYPVNFGFRSQWDTISGDTIIKVEFKINDTWCEWKRLYTAADLTRARSLVALADQAARMALEDYTAAALKARKP